MWAGSVDKFFNISDVLPPVWRVQREVVERALSAHCFDEFREGRTALVAHMLKDGAAAPERLIVSLSAHVACRVVDDLFHGAQRFAEPTVVVAHIQVNR